MSDELEARSNSLDIAVLPGDGIGPEICAVACRALEFLNERNSLGLRLQHWPIGLAAHEQSGTTIPEQTMQAVQTADATVLAPADTYAYPTPEEGGINPSAWVRKTLDLYANIRPAKAIPGVPCFAPNIDLVVVRENTEGFYADRSMFQGSGEFMPTPDVALAVRKITREGCTRIARTAFELARNRRKLVTMVHKANVLTVSDGLFVECVESVAKDFPDVTLDESIIDAMTARLIRNPEVFDVVVTTNMYGDILSDEATELAGGLGLGGALNAGAEHGVAQATHGSAPDIAGQNLANPTAMVLSCAMMLEWLGAKHQRTDIETAARQLRSAVEATLASPRGRTADLGGSCSTSGFADELLTHL